MKFILIICCAFVLSGCAGLLGRHTAKFDKVETVKVDHLIGNNLTQTPLDQKVVYLNARCETKRDGQKKYYLFTETITPADFVLQAGESLILNLDDEVLMFAPTNAPSYNGRKRFVTTFYSVPPEILIKLATAKEGRLRIKGANATLDRRVTRRNLRLFKEFAEKCSLVPTLKPMGG